MIISDVPIYIFYLYFLPTLQEQLRRAERKNRDAFRKLLEEHVADGILTAKTYWREYCSKVVKVIMKENWSVMRKKFYLLVLSI